MNKPTVLFLLHLPPPVHGSSMVGKYIYDSEKINQSYECRFINLLASEKVDDSGKITLSKVWGYFGTIITLLNTLVFHRPKLCYLALSTTGAAFIKDSLLVFFLKVFRIKIVYHLHNKGVCEYGTNKLYNRLYHFVFKKSRVILLSNRLYDDISKYVMKKQVVICPNGIPVVQQEDESIPTIIQDVVQFFFLSNLIESKGVYILLEACSLLKNEGYGFLLKMVGGQGDITEEELNKKIYELSLQKEVQYLGKQYGKDKERIFKCSDVFVFPTFYRNETFGLVNIEAMQYALPVISCAEGGIPDIVKHNETGFIVPQKDAVALADRMKNFINKPELIQEMGRKGRERFYENYTLEIFEERLKRILDKELENNAQ